MKKRIFIVLLCLVVVAAIGIGAYFLLNRSQDGGKETNTLFVYNWGDYIDMDTVAMFEEETGIRVVYEMYETVEDMYTKLQRTGASYDLVCPSDYMIERMIQEDMLQPLDLNNIPNYDQIDPKFLERTAVFDPGNQYSVPYTWGTMGILYNETMVSEAPTSWATLWDEQYAGEIAMLNARDSIWITLKYLGYSLNTTDTAQLEEAKQLLIDQKPLVLGYFVDEIKDKMIAGEAAVGLAWAGDATYCMDENEDLNYVIPEEGSNLFFDSWCIPATAQNKEGAELFIDFLCRPEIAKINYEYVGYAIPNMGAIELLGEEYLDSPVSNPPQEALDNCEIARHGPQAQLYELLWTEIRTAN